VADLTATLDRLSSLQGDLARAETLRDSARRQLDESEDEVMRLTAEKEVLSRVADLFRLLIDREVIDNAKTAEGLLTEGLQAVFDDLDLSVRAEVEVKRGKVSVNLLTIQKYPDGTTTEGSSMDSYGGSIATVQSVLLRIVVLTRRGLRPLLLLDESLGAVAERYVPRVGKFLALLADRLGLDILAVSHNPVLVEEATRAYRIRNKKGVASFNLVGRK
tara:strand:- start:2528 stop:3181 length:654 start_codon:yes stop_codon:yes gene_type:complete